ncbi:MAG TPA: hypothetical protein VMD06_04230 [Steroidobacteraceae bacterium]|nr:hypothetical protein [Steroidobacteraceae bacterium]
MSLLLLYGRIASEAQIAPVIGPATLALVLGVPLMLVMVLQAGARTAHNVETAL